MNPESLFRMSLAGALFFVFAVLLGAQTLYLKLAGRTVSGFATVILLELIIESSLRISLGIVANTWLASTKK
jgi:dolichol-phosphate mannosyltransferase